MRLSIIIPGYNTPEMFWRRCLKSVLLSCGPDDEVLCVDDGSQMPVQKEWLRGNGRKDDPRVRLIRLERNSGLPTARNVAMEVATGEFVTFVDSDDELIPGGYEKCLAALDKHQTDIAIYGAECVWINNGQYKINVLEDCNIGKFNAETLARVCKACLFDTAWNKVYRFSFLNEHKLRFEPDVRTGEDTVFNCSCVVAGAKWCTVNTTSYIYYRYDGSMLSRFVPNMRATHLRKLQSRVAARATCPGIDELLGDSVEISSGVLDAVEWRNMWLRGSPFSLCERWRFLRSHGSLAKRFNLSYFAGLVIYWFLRRHFYVRPIRRWHVRRLFPEVKEYPEQYVGH